MNLRKNPVINLFVYSWKYSPKKKIFIYFISFSVVANIISVMEPIVIGRVFNSIQFSSSDPKLLTYIIRNLLLLIVITIGFWFFHGTSRVIEMKNGFLVRKIYKKDMFKKVMELPVEWHKNNHSGDTIDKINKASNSLYNFSSLIFKIVENVVKLLGSLIILFFYDWRIAVGAIIVSSVAVFTSLKFDNILRSGYKKIFKAENYLASAIHDYISNVITIITLRLKKRVYTEIENRSMMEFDTFSRNRKIDEFRWFTISLYVSITITCALIFSAYTSYKMKGVIVMGTLFVLYKYLSNIGSFFYSFANQYSNYVRQDTAMRLAEIIENDYEKTKNNIETYNLPKNWQTIQIKNLYFSYKENNQEVNGRYNIENISLKIHKNSKIALIGESGSGKSTFLSLLRGNHLAKSVNLYCDGKKLEHGLNYFYEQTTLIPQDPEIFNTSIKDNITMGVVSRKIDIENALRISRFNIVLPKLKKGLKTNVMEKGVSLSGGEKQRLALARGLLMSKKYHFILLDEPTSSVDSDNEIRIYKSIFENYLDKTIISSIHRLHLLRYFDYIYFFKAGKIVCEGTFNTLMNDKDFKVLWRNYSKHTQN